MLRISQALSLILSIALLVECGPSSEVKRVSPEKQTDLSGPWNDTDAQRVAEDMVKDVLNAAWLS
jgi:hypothetical protein